jgi:hypothetical protein
MSSKGPAKLPVIIVLFSLVSACQPTIDLSGTYTAHDYPWSGLPKIDVHTTFPVPWFTGMFTTYDFFEYTEIPIRGPINDENEIRFIPRHEDMPVTGLCVCQGFDDGSSIFTGSGEIAGDGLSDRLSCGTFLGEPHDPPAEVYRIDWPET